MKVSLEINPVLPEIEVTIATASHTAESQQLFQYVTHFEREHTNLSFKTIDGFAIVVQAEIEAIEITGTNISILTATESYQTKGRLYQLKNDLNPQWFVQVSKSAIINLQQVVRLENYFSGSMLAFLKSGRKVPISRSFLPKIKQNLHI